MEDLFFHNIDKYVYDECTVEEMKLFEKHMETCEKCREEYELSCSVKNAMSSMNTIVPPADFSKLVNERLDRELAAPKKPRLLATGYRKYSAVAACVVLAAVLGTNGANVSDPVVLESSTLTGESLQPVPDNAEDVPTAVTEDTLQAEVPQPTNTAGPTAAVSAQPVKKTQAKKSNVAKTVETPAPAPDLKASAEKAEQSVSVPVYSLTSEAEAPSPKTTTAKESIASTISTPVAEPAVNNQTPAPDVKNVPASSEPVQTEAPKATTNDALSKIPAHLNPENQVVLVSSVEKTYEISGVSPEDIPRKERDLAAEFALLDTTKSGAIVANSATISSMEGVQFQISGSKSTPADYGIGSGSLFVSSSDKEIVDELLDKYDTVTDRDCYFITNDNYNMLIEEMDEYGVSYQERVITKDGGNVAFKLIVS